MARSGVLTLLQLNDSHAYQESHQELFWSGTGAICAPAGGYARIAALLAQVRRERPGQVLALDCGDTLHGTYPAVSSRGEVLPPLLNALGFEAMTAHWEFAYGPARLRELASQLRYPVLAANCYDAASGQLVFSPYHLCEAGGLRVGVIGIASNIIDRTMPPSFSEGVRFTLGREELPRHIDTLRQEEKADLIVLLSHLGFPQDLKLVEAVPGVDVVLSGHTHNRLSAPVVSSGAIVIQSGCHGSFLGRLDLEVEHGKVVEHSHELITVRAEIEPDRDVQGLVEQALQPYRKELDQVVGSTETGLNRSTVLEATMDNFLLQSLQHLTGAQLAFANGWRYGAPVPPGPVTLNDLYNIIPMNPPVSTVELTGEEIWSMLEENLERTFSRDPYQQMGGYVKRCLGLRMYAKLENPRGQRLQELFVGEERVARERVYTAAFVTAQAIPAPYGRNRQDTDTRAVDALASYLATGPVRAELTGTVTLV